MPNDAAPLLAMYRAASELPTLEFQEFALKLARSRVRFVAAMWGCGYFSSGDSLDDLRPIKSLCHQHETDPDGLAEWQSLRTRDKAVPLLFKRPLTMFGFHSPSLFSGKDDGDMRDYARRFGRQNALMMALSTPQNALVEWCSLFRPGEEDRFSATERQRAQHLVLHMSQGLRINRMLRQPDIEGRLGDLSTDLPRGRSLMTADGQLMATDSAFIDACRREWREFDATRLPRAAQRQLLDDRIAAYWGATIHLRIRRMGELALLTATPLHRASVLPARRENAATLFADGYSCKEIARMLDISPATARNHVSASYQQLGVSTRGQLKSALARGRSTRDSMDD